MALLDAQVAWLANQASNYLVSGKVPRRMGNAHPNIVPYETFKAKDGTYIALGQAYLKLKNYQKAIDWLKRGQSLASQDTKVNYYLGMALAGLHRYSEALQAFRLAGDEAQAYNNIGVHYFMEGRYEEAARCFQRAIDLRPTFYQEAKTNLHRALEKLQQPRNDNS